MLTPDATMSPMNESRVSTRRQRPGRLTASVGVAILCSVTTVAQGAGFAILEASASRLGTAFAGTASAADDATAVFFNPAAIAFLQTPEATIVASGISISSKFSNRGSQSALGVQLGDAGGNAGGWNFVPSAYLSVPLSETWSIGFGINAPFGLRSEYDRGWIGRFQALESEIKTINYNPTVAYRVNSRLSIGVGLNYQTVDAELSNAVNYSAIVAQGAQLLASANALPPGAIPDLLASSQGLEGMARVVGDDEAFGYNLGVLFVPFAGTRIGLAYRSALRYDVQGRASFTPPSAGDPIASAILDAASSNGAPLADGPVKVQLELPDSATLSLSQRFGQKIELLADISWTGWSSIQELRILRTSGATLSVVPQNWSDTVRFAAGIAYTLRPAVIIRAGIMFDETPVPDSTRNARLPDGDRTFVCVGARWTPSPSLVIDLGYGHLFGEDVALNQDAGNPAASAVLSGRQTLAADVFSTQLAYRF